jgi:ubiquinone/menaquinone biosynthesis C-methylase UbiE
VNGTESDQARQPTAGTVEEPIDVRRLLQEMTVEEACATAERYFSHLRNWDYHLAKPFNSAEDVPALLMNVSMLLQGLSLFPGMTVLDFGAGSCWTTRLLAQMGFRAIAADVSRSALAIGEELLRRLPLIGERPTPRLLHFDGHHLDLPDASVDRVMCLDAFHHVPNQAEVLAELARVLSDGGVAGFSEPGPEHSKAPQSQYEMRTYQVIENDVDIREIWRLARAAGFTDISLSVFSVPQFQVSLDEFDDFLDGGAVATRFSEISRQFMQDRRTFFLYKGERRSSSAHYRSGLRAELAVEPRQLRAVADGPIALTVTATNIGTSTWLPKSFGVGAVYLGVHLYDDAGRIVHHSYHWELLTPGEGRFVPPGETVTVATAIPPPPPGRYVVELDLVCDGFIWFGLNGSATPRVVLEVVPAAEVDAS